MPAMSRRVVVTALILLCVLFAEAQATRLFVEHRVRWMETIYSISKKYGVEPNTVLNYNNMSANQIRRGIIIRIPVAPLEGNEVNPIDSLNLIEPVHTSNYLAECLAYKPSPQTEHHVSLILPFDLSNPQPNTQFLEFYEGILLAVNDLKEEGMSLRLSLYDSGNAAQLPSLVQSGALNQDLVIGPIYAKELFEMMNYTSGQEIKIISPLDPLTESAAYTNPNFFQVNTSLYWQQVNLIQSLMNNGGVVWLFHEEEGADQELVAITKEILRKNHVVYQEFVHRVAKDRDITGELALRLTQLQDNQVIVASSNEPFVSDILRNLFVVQLRRNCPITLYGNAKWRSFESVDLEYYHSMNLHLSVPNYVDYQRPEVKHFIARYRSIFRAEPTPFAYQGYDVGVYFFRALFTKGAHFDYCLEQGVVPTQLLQSNFRFQKVSDDGGFINTNTRIIHYLPDYSVKLIY